jgi:thioredoxin 1
MSSAPAVTRSDFETQVLQSDQPVLVDFWAAWCPPCRALAPTLDAVAGDYEGKAKIVKVDIDAEPEIADRYGIRSIPTLILFKNGSQVSELVGAHPKATITQLLDDAL